MGDLEIEAENNKKLANLQREVAIDTKRLTISEMSHASRWIMASMLAINSGGLIAAISKVDDFEIWSASSVITFYLGVMTALMMGWAQVSMNQKLLPIHSKLIIFWETATLDGQLGNVKDLENIRDEMLATGKKGLFANSLGKWAFFLFSLGLLCLGVSLIPNQAEVERPVERTEISF